MTFFHIGTELEVGNAQCEPFVNTRFKMVSKEEQLLKKDKRNALLRGKLEEAAAICNLLGDLKAKEQNFEDALEEHQEELELSERVGKKESEAIAHRRVGETLAKLCRFHEALEHHKVYLDIVENCENVIEIQRAWATIGWTHFNYYSAIADEEIEEPCTNKVNILNQAHDAYAQSFEYAKRLEGKIPDKEFSEMKARLLLNVALVYEQRNDMKDCATTLRKAIYLCKKNNLVEDLHRCQYSLASIYFTHGEIDPASNAVNEAMNSAKVMKDRVCMTDSLMLKSKIQIAKKDFTIGKKYAKKAYKSCLPASKEHVGVFLRNVIGVHKTLEALNKEVKQDMKCILHEKLADEFSSVGCYALAVANYQEALRLAIELDKPLNNVASLHFSLAQTYADLSNYPKAIHHWQEEIVCNKGNPKEICSTLLVIAKTQEKQGCSATTILETFNNALKMASHSNNKFSEYDCMEKLINYEKRQGVTCSSALIDNFNTLKEDLSGEDEDVIVDSEPSSTEEKSFDDIDLDNISDFSDSDIENVEQTARNHNRRPFKIGKNEKGETPLHKACMSGNLKQVKRLILQGHPVNPRDHAGWLPIHEAANFGFKDIVEYLIDNGAWINDKGGDYCGGITPLLDAAAGGHLEVMKLLLSKGASASALTSTGATPLSCFMEWRREMDGELDNDVLEQCREIEDLLKASSPKLSSQKKSRTKHSNLGKSVCDAGWVTEDRQEAEVFSYNEENVALTDDENEMDAEEEFDNHLLPVNEITNDFEDPEVATNEYCSVITNLRTKPMRKIEKRPDEEIDNPLHTSDDWIIDDTSGKPKTTTKKRKRTLDDFACFKKIPRVPPERKVSKFVIERELVEEPIVIVEPPCRTITMHICGEVLAIPVPDPALTFSWLAERAAESYSDTHGMKPRLTLLRGDGAVISKQDLVSSVKDTVVTAQVDSWEGLSLIERFRRACSSQGIGVTKGVESEVIRLGNCHCVEVTTGSVLKHPYLNSLLKAIRFETSLKSLSLNELKLSDDVINVLCKSLPNLVGLQHMNLSCCNLDDAKLMQFAHALSKNSNSSNSFQMQHLDLSYNSFGNECAGSFRTLFLHFTLLTTVNLAFCDLPHSCFRDKELMSSVQKLKFLRVLHIAGNKLSKRAMTDYLDCIATMNLISLDLSCTCSVVMESSLGELIVQYLPHFGSSLQVLSLRECNLDDGDLVCISEFLKHCPQIEKLDISVNPSISWAGIKSVIDSANMHELPLHNLVFIGCDFDGADDWSSCFQLVKIGQLRKMTVEMSDQDTSEVFELLQKEWNSVFGQRACVTKDVFGTVTFSNKF